MKAVRLLEYGKQVVFDDVPTPTSSGEPAARVWGVQSRGSDGPAAEAEAALARGRGFASGEIQPGMALDFEDRSRHWCFNGGGCLYA